MKRSYQTRTARALFEPTQAGALKLANRIVMAPLARNRAGPGLVPGPFALEYYAQRATAGLIIAEATQISAQAQGYCGYAGLLYGRSGPGLESRHRRRARQGRDHGRSALAYRPRLSHKLPEGRSRARRAV